jgi:hypothetical protein
MGNAGEERPTKACPDCAESVLLEARRCRFCGYRFDEPEEIAANPSGRSWLALLRRPARRSTIPSYLAQAGVMLDDDEQPAGMWLGRVNGNDAYIIVTTARLFVTEVKLHQRRPSLVVGHALSDLLRVEDGPGLLHRTLVMEWKYSARTVVTKLSSRDIEALKTTLGPGGQPNL